MITLINSAKTSGTELLLGFRIDLEDDLDNLPNEDKPFDRDFYPVFGDFGVPAENSYALCEENGKTYLFVDGEWAEAGKSYEIIEKTFDTNGTFEAPEGQAYGTVIVSVTPEAIE